MKWVVVAVVLSLTMLGAAAAGARGATTFEVVGVEQQDVLNVRANPSPSAEIVGTIPPDGTGLQVAECVTVVNDGGQTWCRVQFGAVEGWANGRYLAARTGRAEDISTTDTYDVIGVAPGDALNARASASPSSEIMGVVPFNGRGLRVTQCVDVRRLDGSTQAWCQIAFGKVVGWVNARYLHPFEVRDATASSSDPQSAPAVVGPESETESPQQPQQAPTQPQNNRGPTGESDRSSGGTDLWIPNLVGVAIVGWFLLNTVFPLFPFRQRGVNFLVALTSAVALLAFNFEHGDFGDLRAKVESMACGDSAETTIPRVALSHVSALALRTESLSRFQLPKGCWSQFAYVPLSVDEARSNSISLSDDDSHYGRVLFGSREISFIVSKENLTEKWRRHYEWLYGDISDWDGVVYKSGYAIDQESGVPFGFLGAINGMKGKITIGNKSGDSFNYTNYSEFERDLLVASSQGQPLSVLVQVTIFRDRAYGLELGVYPEIFFVNPPVGLDCPLTRLGHNGLTSCKVGRETDASVMHLKPESGDRPGDGVATTQQKSPNLGTADSVESGAPSIEERTRDAGIAGSLCDVGQGILLNSTLPMRDSGVPIDTAQGVTDSFRDQQRFREFMRFSVREVYRDPASMRSKIESNRWYNACVKYVRGF